MTYFPEHIGFPVYWRRVCRLLLTFSFLAGLVLGVFFASTASESYLLMMRQAFLRPVSIVGLLSIFLLPFLFSFLAVFLLKPWLLAPICFCKAFTYGLCARIVAMASGSADWLLHILLLFSDTCALVLLCWFWLRHIACTKVTVITDAAICIVVFIILGTFDYCCLSPFLAMLIKN